MTELLVGTKKGLFVLEGEPGDDVRDQDPRLRGRTRRVRAARAAVGPRPGLRHLALLRAQDLLRPTIRPASGSRPRASSCPTAATWRSSGSGRSCPVRRTARSTRAAIPACCSSAATAASASSSTSRCFQHPTRRYWQPGAGGHVPALDRPVAGRAGPPGDRDLGRRRVADRRRRADAGAAATRGWSPATCPRARRPTRSPLCVHRIHRAPTRPERLFLQFHGGVYRSDDAGESSIDIATACPPTSASRWPSTRPTPTART